MYDICDPFTGRNRMTVPTKTLARLIVSAYKRRGRTADLDLDYVRKGEGWI